MFIISECADHGIKAVADYDSARVYFLMSIECATDARTDESGHAAWHRAEGHDCWSCCDRCVIDPQGYFDH